jgi:hypothetical protein
MNDNKRVNIALSVADYANAQIILDEFPYLRGNITAAISLALYEVAARVVIDNEDKPQETE